MKVGLFIPCYVDAFFPEVGVASLEILERFGVDVSYPLDQTCCGQPMANSGCQTDAAPAETLFVANFKEFDYIVTPSGSCTHHVRSHFDAIPQTAEVTKVRGSVYELVEFLHDVLKVDEFPWAEFPHRVGLHNTCSTLRDLRTASASEINEPFFSKPLDLLRKVKGIEFVTPERPDECCGFGGSFAVRYPQISGAMVQDKAAFIEKTGADVVVATDAGCLMNIGGCLRRRGSKVKPLHLAQILEKT